MQCKSCGATLEARVATCPSCGTATPYNVTTSAPEAFNAQPDPTVPDNSGEDQIPPPVVSKGEETPQIERTVLRQPPQPETAESMNVARTVLQQPSPPNTPAPQVVVERTVLQQPPQADIAPHGPAQQLGSPQPAPPSSSPAWQQPQPIQAQQAQQPGISQPWPGPQAQQGPAQAQQGQPWPQLSPGQQAPQQGSWQPQQGPSQPLLWPQQGQQPMGPQSYPAWPQPQQPWPQPFPGQQPQQGPWQPQPAMPQPLPWPQPLQQGQPWTQPFPGQQPPQQGPWQPLPVQPQRRNLPVLIAVLLIMLALLTGSGLTYYYVTTIAHPPQHQPQATTATTQTLTSVQSTSTITATNPQDLYTQATSGTPALDTTSGSQNASDWQAPGANVSCTFSGTALRATASQQASLCLDRSTSFDNFAYQAQATITQGYVIGLIFRADTISSKLYAFAISSDGVYVLESGQSSSLSGNNAKILAGASSTAINTGLNQSNLLTIIARGNTIYLYINKQYLTSVNDSTSSSGMIGVFGENTRNGPVDVTFSKIQVWKL